MRGLLEKDIRLLLQRKNMLLLFIILGFSLGMSQSGAFILGYLPFLILVVLISTISYDEIENGYQFLMTLPVNRKLYVQEKYLLCILGAIGSWIVADILYFVAKLVRDEEIILKEELQMIVSFLPVIFLMMSIIIPLQLKFGAEKSRIVLLGTLGAVGAAIHILIKLIGNEKINVVLQQLDSIQDKLIVAVGIGFMLIVIVVSFLISCRIMDRKEL